MSLPEAPAPVFAEPWQAQIFALAVALQNAGLFSAQEWAQALGAEIDRALAQGGCRDGSDYYERWCAALETLLAEKGIATPAIVGERAAAWERAAHATPHGQPILLENDPQR